MSSHRHVTIDHEEIERVGGWFCYGQCRAFTELNMDREQNVCLRCGRPTVKFLPTVQIGPAERDAEGNPILLPKQHKRVTRERRVAAGTAESAGLFAALKEAVR